MSAALQERLQMSRTPFDKWTKREQLCLASAVSCSGDQNWITVSRTLKTVCGGSEHETRPADWYSQKNCAVQYGHLLESVETTKRKKRSSENGAAVSSPATVEPPTELLLRRLTEERLAEIKIQMRQDQEEFKKVQREIDALAGDELSEQQLQEMWKKMENEQEKQRIEEMKLENRMREREQRKKELSSGWRNLGGNNATARRTNSAPDTTAVDMEVEDIPVAGASNIKTQPQPATSPLLTSLLKSPTASGNSPSSIVSAGSVARSTAPTITSLLTSGASAIPNQPALILKNANDSSLITRPISGPPAAESNIATGTGKSPSQAAPTLSMLLEKNKTATKSNESSQSAAQADASSNVSTAVELENVESTASAANTNITAADSDETDLLDVFNNMDDIMDDEMVNDMADILKDVEDVTASPGTAKQEAIDFQDKLEREPTIGRSNSNKSAILPQTSKESVNLKPLEVVIGSSDDSNDNIPLATVASQESKDRSNSNLEENSLIEDTETVALASEVAVEEITESTSLVGDTAEVTKLSNIRHIEDNSEKSAAKSVVDPIQNLTVEDIIEETTAVEEIPENEIKSSKLEDFKSKPEASEHKQKPTTAASQISMHDTDEEYSSLTDSSKQDEPLRSSKSKQQPRKSTSDETKSELDQATVNSTSSSSPQPPPAAGTITTAPARPPLLRKLPHRDRSESPMIDDDTATASDHSTAKPPSTRRRCSSTPVIDSIPNSPASSEHTDDRRETRGASKKIFLGIYSILSESKHALPFRRPFHDEHAHKIAELCLRPMDLPTIKRNIDSGSIRSISELQRDVLLMCQNIILIYKPHAAQHKAAKLFLQECHTIKEFVGHHEGSANVSASRTEKEKHTSNKARSGFRKSQRHH